jgi:hypothetical protein
MPHQDCGRATAAARAPLFAKVGFLAEGLKVAAHVVGAARSADRRSDVAIRRRQTLVN